MLQARPAGCAATQVQWSVSMVDFACSRQDPLAGPGGHFNFAELSTSTGWTGQGAKSGKTDIKIAFAVFTVLPVDLIADPTSPTDLSS